MKTNKWEKRLRENTIKSIKAVFETFEAHYYVPEPEGRELTIERALWFHVIEPVISQELERQKREIIEELKEIKDRKFPRGERRWCIECVNRVYREAIKVIKEL
jgi:hypothetical protein